MRKTVFAILAAALLTVSFAVAGPAMGRYNILVDAHGYNNGGTVLLPLRAISEWLGAEVTFKSGLITIRDGSRTVSLRTDAQSATLNGMSVKLARPARVYGGITCVPVRFVGEAFGCQVAYRTENRDINLFTNHVEITRNGSTARVLIHKTSPDRVVPLVDAMSPARGTYGTDWIAEVVYYRGGYWYVISSGWIGADPGWPEMQNRFYMGEDSTEIWGSASGRVQYLLGGLFEKADMLAAGMPPTVVDAFIANKAYSSW